MRKSFLLPGLCSVLMLILAVSTDAQTKENFAGTWVLDKSKSELTQMMQNLEGITWNITQDEKQISREQKFEGASGSGRGGMIGNVPLTVKLDGSETVTDAPRISGKRTATSKLTGDGKILEVSVVTTGSFQGNEIKSTTTEHWELTEGGKVLKVHQKVDGTRGTFESKMIFNKK
jgi:hypothetical protein